MNELPEKSVPSVQVTVWCDHGANIFGVLGNLRVLDFITEDGDPFTQGSAFLISLVDPADISCSSG